MREMPGNKKEDRKLGREDGAEAAKGESVSIITIASIISLVCPRDSRRLKTHWHSVLALRHWVVEADASGSPA